MNGPERLRCREYWHDSLRSGLLSLPVMGSSGRFLGVLQKTLPWILGKSFAPTSSSPSAVPYSLSLYQRFIPISFSLFVCFVGGSDSRSTRGYYIVKPFNYLGKLLSRNIRPVLNECTIVCRGWCTFRCNPLSSSPPPRNSFLPLLFYPLRLFFVSTFFRFFDVFLSLSFHRSW